jgi:hypothetical protein
LNCAIALAAESAAIAMAIANVFIRLSFQVWHLLIAC